MNYSLGLFLFFFFKQKTAYEMRISDWSSDVCSSDLNSGPGGNDLAPARDWLALADAFYAASVESTPAIPVIWGTDAVHGHSNIVGATLFPHNVGLGAARDPDLIERIGDRKSTRLNSSHSCASRMPSSA